MPHPRELEVINGIWIDPDELHRADLRGRVGVEVEQGEIRIVPAAQPAADEHESAAAWKLILEMGLRATAGALDAPSEHHDLFLYGAD